MQIFAAVARHGSMSAAARVLRLTPSAVSQQIKSLEQRAGVTLLLRTTRSLTLTDAGVRFHAACAAMVSAAERARAELENAREEPVGELRISAPVGFARHLQDALRGVVAHNRSLSLVQILDDQRRNLIADRIDLGIAFGNLPDSDWSAQRLGRFDFWLCASPGALEDLAAPRLPEDLAMHPWLWIAGDSAERALVLDASNGERASLAVAPRIVANNQQAIESACLAGLGVAKLSSLDVHTHVVEGRLVRLLPGWTAGTYDIWALTPQRDARPPKVRLAIEALRSYLQIAAGARA